MAKSKKLKLQQKAGFMWVFLNGKQVRVKRPVLIDGLSPDEWIENNADPIFLHCEGMHAELYARELAEGDFGCHELSDCDLSDCNLSDCNLSDRNLSDRNLSKRDN